MKKDSVAILITGDQVPGFTVNDLAGRPEALQVLMCSADYFNIVDVKNAYMEGQAGNLDKPLALKQWDNLHQVYTHLKQQGVVQDVHVIPGALDCEDMVFCANQTFPWLGATGEKLVVMSKMRHPSRQREVEYFEQFFKSIGYRVLHLQQTQMFEGMGDAIPHPGKRLLYGGYGHRTSPEAYNEIAVLLQTPVVALELVSPNFYHLDTCFVPLGVDDVMLCKEAFTATGLDMIRALFKNVYEIPEAEAVQTFCLNAHVMHNPANGKKAAVIQKGSVHAKAALEKCGYEVIETDTSEFMKSGGSVFCMKMMFY